MTAPRIALEPAGAGAATAEEPTSTEPAPDVLTPPPEPKPAEVVQRKFTEPEPETPPPSHVAEWLVGGVAAVALVGGVVTNFIARAKMDTCRADANNGLFATANTECNAAKPMAFTSYALLSVAAAGVALDAVLIILHHKGEDSSSGGGDEASLGVMLLPGGGGLSARGRF